jgi:hypothetical protein
LQIEQHALAMRSGEPLTAHGKRAHGWNLEHLQDRFGSNPKLSAV